MAVPEGQAEKHEEALKFKDEGNLAFKEKRYNKAVKLYTDSLVLERNHLVFGNRAQTFIHLAQYELALRDINEALEMEPTFVKNLNRRAKVLANLGMYSEALADSATILKMNPKDKVAMADAAAWEGKENLRSVEVKQWNGGEEFIEDEMVSIPIEGLEAYDRIDPPATVPPVNTVSTEEKEGDAVVPHEDTVADDSDKNTTYSSDKETSSKDTMSDDGSLTSSDEDTVAVEETAPEDTVEEATVTTEVTVAETTVEEATVTPEVTVANEEVTVVAEEKALSFEEEEITVSPAELDTISEGEEYDDSSKYSDEEEEDTVAEATVTPKETVADVRPTEPTVAQSPTASVAAVSPSSEDTFLSAPGDSVTGDSNSNASWDDVKNDSMSSSISDLHSMSKDSEDGYTTSPCTPNDTVDDEEEKEVEEVAPVDQSIPDTVPEEVTVEKKVEEEQKEEEVPIVGEDSAATVPEETEEVKKKEKEEEGKGDGQVPIVNESATTVPEEITVLNEKQQQEKEEGGKKSEQVSVVPTAPATVPVESTVERNDQEDTVVKKIDGDTVVSKEKKKKEKDTVAKEETTVVKEDETTVVKEEEKKEEEEVTVIDAPAPTVIPAPAQNFLQFEEHFKALKHDLPAFGKYFLTINPGIISMMLDIDHVRAIVDGLTTVAGEEVADLSAISSSLLVLCNLQRFDIIVMFMNDQDKAKAHSLIDLLPSTHETAHIRASFE